MKLYNINIIDILLDILLEDMFEDIYNVSITEEEINEFLYNRYDR